MSCGRTGQSKEALREGEKMELLLQLCVLWKARTEQEGAGGGGNRVA